MEPQGARIRRDRQDRDRSRSARGPRAEATPTPAAKPQRSAQPAVSRAPERKAPAAPVPYADRKKQEADARRARKEADARQRRVQELEGRIAEREEAIKELERTMAAPGFYENRERRATDHRPPPIADVGGRRSDASVGSAPDGNKSVITGQICYQPIRSRQPPFRPFSKQICVFRPHRPGTRFAPSAVVLTDLERRSEPCRRSWLVTRNSNMQKSLAQSDAAITILSPEPQPGSELFAMADKRAQKSSSGKAGRVAKARPSCTARRGHRGRPRRPRGVLPRPRLEPPERRPRHHP